MDKKDKILLIVVPVALATMGYAFFGKTLFGDGEMTVEEPDNFTSIEAPVTEARKKRTELYRDKYEKENADKIKRNVQSDEFFFGEEVKRDSGSEERQELGSRELGGRERQELGSRELGGREKQGGQGVGGNEWKTKEKVIVKYIEKVVPGDTVTKYVEGAVVKRQVRRSGFVSGKTEAVNVVEDTSEEKANEVSIPVVVQESTDVKSGSNIQLRTLEEVKVNGVTIPKNTLITGVANVTQERLNIRVGTLKGVNRTVQMKLDAYDLDGNAGMPVEGGVNKEIKKDVVGSVIQETGRIVNVPILGRTPINAGNKKMNDPVIPVPKGYKLFLKREVK